jgi:hypothetical protein
VRSGRGPPFGLTYTDVPPGPRRAYSTACFPRCFLCTRSPPGRLVPIPARAHIFLARRSPSPARCLCLRTEPRAMGWDYDSGACARPPRPRPRVRHAVLTPTRRRAPAARGPARRPWPAPAFLSRRPALPAPALRPRCSRRRRLFRYVSAASFMRSHLPCAACAP